MSTRERRWRRHQCRWECGRQYGCAKTLLSGRHTMRRIGTLLSCCLVALLVLPVLAYAFGDEVVVGFMVPLTKKGASYGVQSRAATEIAVEEINAQGGVGGRKLVAITKDTEGDN